MADRNSIEHLIVLMMENRSFDHYLGSLTLEGRQDIAGLPTPLPINLDKDGNIVTAWNMDGWYRGYGDSPHGWDAQHNSYDNGRNDGFVREYQQAFPDTQNGTAPAKIPMGYYTRATLPILYALADRFTVCDHWFCSLLSSTWPNRKYYHSGRRDNDNDTQTIPLPPGFRTVPYYTALEKTNNPATGTPYTWRCYFSDLPFLGFWYEFAATHFGNFSLVDDFAEDCRDDKLPTVSIIDPPFSIADDHPAHDVRLGQKFIGLIVDALTHSISWSKSALVILYDENGGFYDHVRPPISFEVAAGLPAEDDPLGFRVPALVISPYALRAKACTTAFDHTSIMSSVHARWDISFDPAVFGARWQYAPDLWANCFDFTQEPLPTGTYTLPQNPADQKAAQVIRNLDWEVGVEEQITSFAGGIEMFLERIFLQWKLKGLDNRSNVHNTLQSLEQNVTAMKAATA